VPKSTGPEGAVPSPSKRRANLLKRRYKSGIPLTSERGHDDPLEESYLASFSLASAAAAAASKTSKDDSHISLQDSGCHVAAHHKQVARDGEYLFWAGVEQLGLSPRS